MKIIFLDTETTSSGEDREMIQLAYRIIENGKLIKSFNEYFKTDAKIEIGAKAVHGITEDVLDLKGYDLDNQIGVSIDEDLNDGYIIAHNSTFDKETLRKHGFEVDEYKWIDSYIIAYNLLTEDMVEAYNLQYLRYYFFPQDIEFSEGITAHDALGDILVLEKVFEQLIKIYLVNQKEDGEENIEMYQQMVEETSKGTILRICKFPKHKGKLWVQVAKEDPGFLNWIWKNVDMDKNLENTILNLMHDSEIKVASKKILGA